jgi:hypothetical protein
MVPDCLRDLTKNSYFEIASCLSLGVEKTKAFTASAMKHTAAIKKNRMGNRSDKLIPRRNGRKIVLCSYFSIFE